jgi:hypothetical protein
VGAARVSTAPEPWQPGQVITMPLPSTISPVPLQQSQMAVSAAGIGGLGEREI